MARNKNINKKKTRLVKAIALSENKLNKIFVLKKIESKGDELKAMGVIRIGLFGSVLKGKSTSKSDVDVLIKFNNSNFDNYAEVILLLERILKRKIDLINESYLRPELNYVKKEAQYARI